MVSMHYNTLNYPQQIPIAKYHILIRSLHKHTLIFGVLYNVIIQLSYSLCGILASWYK